MAASSASGSTKQVLFEPATLATVKVDAAAQPASWAGDLLVVVVTEEDFNAPDPKDKEKQADPVTIKSDRLKELDVASGGAITDILTAGGFDGKQGQKSSVLRLGAAPGLKAKHIALVGVGKAEKLSVAPEWGASVYQGVGAAVAVLAKGARVATAGVLLLDAPAGGAADTATAVGQITAGVLLGGYESTRFKSKPSPTLSKLAEVHLVGAPVAAANAQALDAALSKAKAVAAGTLLTRYLVEAPPNVCTPTHLAEAAAHIAALDPATLKLTVHEKADCEAMGMGMYLGVAECSDHPPKFIHLTYTSPGEGPKKKIALVGKGLTFDSGGYNIKAGAGSMIELMKFDMGGAGATLGAARVIAALKPAGIEAHFIIAACENMIDGKGLRPGDILTSAAGKTVEVNNTDAEGRLTLGDALWYAQEKCGATAIVDSATLTGAAIIALGGEIAALLTPSDKMAASVQAASKAAGEKLWRLPLEQSYFDQLKSSCADMKNTGGRAGGTITAGLFLKQFVKEEVEWAHLDIAGPVWDEKQGLPTGYGAATLAEWAVSQGASA